MHGQQNEKKKHMVVFASDKCLELVNTIQWGDGGE